jgi:hypothetical protein
MDITWHGYSCFSIKTKGGTVVVNPYNEKMGLKLPNLKGDIAIITGVADGHDNIKAVNGDPYTIDWPGEYEVKEIAITALQPPNRKGFLFTLVAENMKIAYIERVGKELNEELVDKIGDVDVLLLAVGGEEVMKPETAHKVIEEIEPRAIIPMHFAVKGATAKIGEVEPFWKLVGASNIEAREKYSIQNRNSLKEDQTEYIQLSPQM